MQRINKTENTEVSLTIVVLARLLVTHEPSHLSRFGSLPNLSGGNWKLLVIAFLFYAINRIKCNFTSSMIFILPITMVWLFAAILCSIHFHQFLKVPLSPVLNRPCSSFVIPKEHCFVYVQQSVVQDYTYAGFRAVGSTHIYMLLVIFDWKLLTNGSNLNRLSKYVLPGSKERIQIHHNCFTLVLVKEQLFSWF